MTQKIDPYRDGEKVVWVVCNSHRAREKLTGRDKNRQAYNLAFTQSDIQHKGIYPIELSDSTRVLSIKGIRRLAKSRIADLSPCWNFS